MQAVCAVHGRRGARRSGAGAQRLNLRTRALQGPGDHGGGEVCELEGGIGARAVADGEQGLQGRTLESARVRSTDHHVPHHHVPLAVRKDEESDDVLEHNVAFVGMPGVHSLLNRLTYRYYVEVTRPLGRPISDSIRLVRGGKRAVLIAAQR